MGKSCLKQLYETSPKKHRNWYIKMQNSALASMIKEKKPHFEEKKALKTLFHNKKTLPWKKAQKKHLFFKNTRWEICIYDKSYFNGYGVPSFVP